MSEKEEIEKQGRFSKFVKSIIRSKKFILFLFFVIISSVLWFLNALEKEYETSIKYKLQFENLPLKDIAVTESSNEISVVIKGFGYNLLKYKLTFSNAPIVIDYNNYKFSRLPNDRNTLYLLSSKLSDYIMKRFNNDVTFISISPDTIFLKTVKASKRKVPITPNIDYSVSEPYRQFGKIEISPDSVFIYGEKEVISLIDSINTEKLSLGSITESVNSYLHLIPIENVNISTDSVKLSIIIEKCSEKTIALPIQPLNFPASSNVLFIPEFVDVIFNISIKEYDNISENDFKLVADYNNRKSGYVPINLMKYPKSVSNIKLSKSEVRFIIESK